MLAAKLLEGLNPEQAAAVQRTEGPLLVVAGAGSGKTRVLTQRIAWLVGVNGLAPESVLAVTFTNKAAGEIRARVANALGHSARDIWLSTFHSSCVRILRREIEQLGRARNFVIYDDADSRAVIKHALAHHGEADATTRASHARRMRWQIDQWKNRGWLPEQVQEQGADDAYTRRAAEVYRTYTRMLREANALDFGDLLLLVVQLFERFPEVLQRYRARWQYVMVDEYQDTNRVQYRLVNQLAGAHRNLCVVGDPDQSIYAWRGADIRNILDFKRDYPDAAVVTLTRNYRSTQNILSAAGAVIANNPARPEKNMVTNRGAGAALGVYTARDDREEARFVVDDILSAHAGDRAFGKCAVLYRTNAQSRAFETELLQRQVPYIVVGGVRFYERAEVKDALAYLRLLVNPADNTALARIVNRPARGIGRSTLEKAQALADAGRVPLLEGLRALAQPGAGGRTANRVRAFLTLLEGLVADIALLTPASAVERIISESGMADSLSKEGTPEAKARLENLRELLTAAEDFERGESENALGARAAAGDEDEDNARSSCEQFLDQVSLVADVDTAALGEENVSLMTVHAAKGLEFATVYLVGLEEGLFPTHGAQADESAIHEERRLCYVGMTRAQSKLVLCRARERRRYGQHTAADPSRFLDEIPAQLCEMLGAPASFAAAPRPHPRPRPQRTPAGEHAYDYSYDQTTPAGAATAAGLATGTRVRHQSFGVGTVLAIEGNGPRQKLSVQFESAGVKKLVLRYANLELA